MRESYLLDSEGRGVVRVSVAEVMRAIRQEGEGDSFAGTVFGVGFPAIAELVNLYYQRGGAREATRESVRAAFAEPHHAALANAHITGGRPGWAYEVDLDQLTVTVAPVAVTPAGDQRRYARRRPWYSTSLGTPARRGLVGGRRLYDRCYVERRTTLAPRRQLKERRAPGGWRHQCDAGIRPLRVWTSTTNMFCANCGTCAARNTGAERRGGVDQRKSWGRRTGDRCL